MKSNQILVTGATGFIGTALVSKLVEENFSVCAPIRNDVNKNFNKNVRIIPMGDFTPDLDWRNALQGVDVIVYLAGRAHIMNDQASDPSAEYRRINVESVLNLANQAALVGIQRFIFLSTIKVNGESTPLGVAFTADDFPQPQDPYAASKYEAERGLLLIAAETEMEVVIIRPPLVYGPKVKANFLNMMSFVNRSIPLPFGAIHNKRSLVALDNLLNLIIVCIDHPAAANQIFLVSDGEDISTTNLLERMGRALDCPVCLMPLPTSWLYFIAVLLGRRPMVERLCLSLQVDISKTRNLLGWAPIIGVDEGLQRAALDFQLSKL